MKFSFSICYRARSFREIQFGYLERLVEPCRFTTASSSPERKSSKLGDKERGTQHLYRSPRWVEGGRHQASSVCRGGGLLSYGRSGTADAGRSVILPLLKRAHVPRKPTNLTLLVREYFECVHATCSYMAHQKHRKHTSSRMNIMEKSVTDDKVFLFHSQNIL